MKRRTRRSGRGRLLWGLLLAVVLVGGAILAIPWLRQLSSNQFRFNANARIRDDETYAIELWVERPPLSDTGPWQEGIQQAIQEFNQLYPNVQVTVTHLAPGNAAARLDSALNEGNPPDLFFSANDSPAHLGELQLPLSRYVDKNERPAWPDSLWNQLQVSDRVYALPVAAYPRVFMINTELWPQSAPEAQVPQQTNWSWSQLISTAEAATSGSIVGYVPTSTGEALLQNLLAGLGKPAAFDNAGNLAWSKEDLIAVANLWLEISQSAGVPGGGATMDNDCLDRFLSQRAAMIGPLNHQLANWLWQAAATQGIQPQLVTSPAVGLTQYCDVRTLGISLLRQEPYQGDSHTRAAAELAQHLVRRLGDLLSSLTGALPATDVAKAAEWLPFDEVSYAAYAEIAQLPANAYAYGPSLSLTQSHWQLGITPAWEKLVQGQYTSEQFAEAVLAELAMATITGP